WYHGHLHGLTSDHAYRGLAGLLSIGRTDGNIPVVTEKKIPIRNMVLQYNFVHGRAGGLAQLDDPNWSQFVSTFTPPKGDELARGTYRPSLAPITSPQPRPGLKYAPEWWAAPLPPKNTRGRMQFIPSNLRPFPPPGDRRDLDLAPDPALPDDKRDVQFTVNGQFQPLIKSRAGQT